MITIGVLKEENNDNRVCLLPEAVQKLTSAGVKVLIESHIGMGLGLSNSDYQKVGAISTTSEKIYTEANFVCSINHRYQNEKLSSEVIFLGIFNPLYHTERMQRYSNFASVYSLDLLPRSSLAQNMDVLSSMASISGYKAVLLAAYYSKNCLPMFTTAAGTIKPARVLVLGAGVAGLQAIATAKRMGAIVEAFDVRSSAGEEVRSLGAKFIEVEGAAESSSAGGYAIAQSDEFQRKQQQLIHSSALLADIIITTANIPGKQAPILIKEATVEQMKSGSVIIDLASEQGGNCEKTVNDRIIQHNGVTIVGNSHLSKSVPLAASQMLSSNYLNFIKLFLSEPSNPLIKAAQVMHKGEFVHPVLQANTQSI